MDKIAIFWLVCGLAAGLIYGIRTKRPGGVAAGIAAVVLLGPIGLVLTLTKSPPGNPPPNA